jgi:hypothetical protein
MAICPHHSRRDHVGMASTTPASSAAPRRLSAVPGPGHRPLDRDAAVRRVRDARRHLESRRERFSHLKRTYD